MTGHGSARSASLDDVSRGSPTERLSGGCLALDSNVDERANPPILC